MLNAEEKKSRLENRIKEPTQTGRWRVRNQLKRSRMQSSEPRRTGVSVEEKENDRVEEFFRSPSLLDRRPELHERELSECEVPRSPALS